jgi:hypothetical protein
VVGPGVLAGLSDDVPAGITTYSISADVGYRLLWVLLLSSGGFKRVEHVLLLLATVFVTDFVSGSTQPVAPRRC